MTGRTLFDKLWDDHVVADLGDGVALLHVDRHLLHDLGSSSAFHDLERRGLVLRNPELHFATADHVVSSATGRTGGVADWADRHIAGLREGCRRWGVRLADVTDATQGIVHVVAPELGISQPGMLVVCGDSHASTNGALGALAWGIGTSELVHVMATQTVLARRPQRMRITFDGRLSRGVEPKDLALALIGRIGAAGGRGYAVEYAGEAVRAMSMDGRMTLCNLTIELGGRIGLVGPDDATFGYLEGRPFAPRGAHWERALDAWRALPTDADAVFDHEVAFDAGAVTPQITWGTSPAHTIGLGERIPDPAACADPSERQAMTAALDYMGLAPGRPVAGTRIDRVFIGSCTNSRLSDLERAAAVVRGRRVAPGVVAWVVPGSQLVKRAAEARGLDRAFREAGFEWREPGCSLCVGANGDMVAPGERCVSTSNRNFVGRQGPGARTHLASPAVAAACALAGEIIGALPETAA
ncbi:MAG: 3-isopropylmalate dehydratase large subunit [Burkholderiales bacterium]|nr:3-isopropylmalate dehydratase large subunit [Burkholderiales bacterium]